MQRQGTISEGKEGEEEGESTQPNMMEEGPSRIQYPPTAARRRGKERDTEGLSLARSESSSCLFRSGDNDAQGRPTTADKEEERQDFLMEDALRSLPPASERHPSRRTYNDTQLGSLARRSSATSSVGPSNTDRGRELSAQLAPSIASSKSIVGGWKDWLAGKSSKDTSSKKVESSKRLEKRLRRAERRAKKREQRAARRSMSLGSEGHDSDSDIVVTMDEPSNAIRPSLDVPPPNETTADALSKVAFGAGAKRPKLHFAPEERKVRRKDLPQDYEQGELYRGLDEYVKAARDRRRMGKRLERRRGSKTSSRGSRSSVSKSSASSGASSSSSSNSDGSSSTGSSSSSASGRLTMARLRAFFGDSSSSSDSSTSSSSDSSSNSSTSSETDSQSTHSSSSRRSFRLFRRRRSSRAGSDSEIDSNPPTPRTPRTPALTFQIKGGAKRRRQRKAIRRYRAQEKRLIDEGRMPLRPSRKARKKAKLAREQAGGVTEYILFTPVALSNSDFTQKHHHHHHQTRPSLSSRGYTQQRVDLHESLTAVASNPPDRVLQTVSFGAVKERLHALRRHRRQIENTAGDVGLGEGDRSTADITTVEKEADKGITRRKKREPIDLDDFDFEDGDLALPPPAMDLPPEDSLDSSSTRKRQRKRKEGDWHMSDVPLTPHIQMATEFSRGFEVGSPRKARFSPTLNTHEEYALPSFHESGNSSNKNHNQEHTPGASSEAQSSSANTKVPSGDPSAMPSPLGGEAHAAWWLDINCPTYRDMTELSKMFPLHPLTVEDVLQQDTREKVEMFESLGYYFVVARAIDEKYFKYTSASAASSGQQVMGNEEEKEGEKVDHSSLAEGGGIEMTEMNTRSKKPRVDIVEGVGGKEGVEGIGVGAINLYLIVFSHGIISFHFEDISKHTNRVRSRLIDLAQPVELTSDWVAHGIFDSIVDAFFPLLSFLESEVEEIEKLTSEPLPSRKQKAAMAANRNRIVGIEKVGVGANSLPIAFVHEKEEQVVLRALPRITLPVLAGHLLPPFLVTRRVNVVRKSSLEAPSLLPHRNIFQTVVGINRKKASKSAFLSNTAQDQSTMLRRITDTRKIVTGLSRLLTPMNDSVRGLRKRLVELREPSISVTEMSIYMGDVHDHIVSLLSHLASSDNRLGDIHFSYLSSIRINNNRVSQSTDEILVLLATITITVFCTIYVISIFSINVNIPNNRDTPYFHWFGGVVAAACCVPPAVIFRTWLWKKQAKRKTEARRAGR